MFLAADECLVKLVDEVLGKLQCSFISLASSQLGVLELAISGAHHRVVLMSCDEHILILTLTTSPSNVRSMVH